MRASPVRESPDGKRLPRRSPAQGHTAHDLRDAMRNAPLVWHSFADIWSSGGRHVRLDLPVTLLESKEVRFMFHRKSVLTACGAAILGLVMTASGKAGGNPNRTTLLTFSGPVALPGVVLAGGTYAFERADGHADIVRVLSRNRSTVYLMAYTRQVERPEGLPAGRPVTFAETSSGAPRIKAWFPLDSSTGHEFIYIDGR